MALTVAVRKTASSRGVAFLVLTPSWRRKLNLEGHSKVMRLETATGPTVPLRAATTLCSAFTPYSALTVLQLPPTLPLTTRRTGSFHAVASDQWLFETSCESHTVLRAPAWKIFAACAGVVLARLLSFMGKSRPVVLSLPNPHSNTCSSLAFFKK